MPPPPKAARSCSVAGAPERVEMARLIAASRYPVILDLAERGLQPQASGALAAAAAALAPTWEEIARFGADQAPLEAINQIEVPERIELTVKLRYVAGAVGQALAAADVDLTFRSPRRFDEDSLIVFERVRREAGLRGRQVHVAGSRGGAQASAIGLSGEAQRLMALCPNGAPVQVIARVAGEPPDDAFVQAGPDGQPWAGLFEGMRRRVLADMAPQERRRRHAALFDAWDPSGWGYLRRAHHAWAAGDAERIAAQAAAVMLAASNLGPVFSLRHAMALARSARPLGLAPGMAARLWADVTTLAKAARETATGVRGLARVLNDVTDPPHRLELHYALANSLARTRRPEALRKARVVYGQAFAELPGVERDDRPRLEIRLLNGLALVAYHEGRDEEALQLELQAHALCRAAETADPRLGAWAKALLNANTAKLLIKRFGDRDQARIYLRSSAGLADDRVRRRALADLAKLAYDDGDFAEAADLLKEALRGGPADENEQEEATASALLALACLHTGDTEGGAKACDRLERICRSLNLDGGLALAAAVRRQACSVEA